MWKLAPPPTGAAWAVDVAVGEALVVAAVGCAEVDVRPEVAGADTDADALGAKSIVSILSEEEVKSRTYPQRRRPQHWRRQ